MKLSDTFIRNAKSSKPNGEKFSDGGGLYLLVKKQGKYWRMDYRYLGKRKTLALGIYPDVSLAKARKRRDKARELLADGIDPGRVKQQEKQEKLISAGNTFEVVAKEWLSKTKARRAESTQQKIITWLQNHVYQHIGKLPVMEIRAHDVLLVARKVEARGAIESAHRVLNLCSQVLRFAVASGMVERDVTPDLKGALEPVPATKHFAAITDSEKVGDLLRAIYGYSGHPYAAAALKLAPLVFVRPGELRSAEWAEISLGESMSNWIIPAEKMKMRQDHIVPLSTQAAKILREMEQLTGGRKYVFPSIRTEERCMSENTINAALRSLGFSADVMTGHGFRATARTLLDEVLGERVDLIEHQLSHAVRDANGRAYNRTTHLKGRRRMMQRWADYLDKLRLQ